MGTRQVLHVISSRLFSLRESTQLIICASLIALCSVSHGRSGALMQAARRRSPNKDPWRQELEKHISAVLPLNYSRLRGRPELNRELQIMNVVPLAFATDQPTPVTKGARVYSVFHL
jgi:hypothetical protein